MVLVSDEFRKNPKISENKFVVFFLNHKKSAIAKFQVFGGFFFFQVD